MARRALRSLLAATIVGAAWLSGCGQMPSPLGVGEFKWDVTPGDVVTIQRGGAGSFTIRLNSKVNINSNVEFSLAGTLPASGTQTFNPQNLGSTGRDSTLTFQTTPQTPEGSYTIQIMATEVGVGTFSEARRVDVVSGTGPDFTLEVEPAELTLTRIGELSSTIVYRLYPRNGFTGTVDMTVEGLTAPPAPLVLVGPLTPAQIVLGQSQGGTFVLGVAERPSYPPTVMLTLRAASGSIVHTRQILVRLTFGGQ
jgi:hypothetical protein